MKKSFTLMVSWVLFTSVQAIGSPALSSLPSAQATIYLDFDGYHVVSAAWNNGNPINCLPSAMTTAQITEAFNRVAEDYRPFNINITTDSTKFLAAPLNRRIRVIVTPTSSWYQGVGGVTYTGSFTWGDDTPCFVFCDRLGPNSPKMVGECCTHESGHSLGLSHQSKYDGNCALVATYHDGFGTGEIGWAPVMGNSYYKNVSRWNNGPTPSGCNSSQDNLAIITKANGFTYRPDDYSDDPNINPAPVTVTYNSFSLNGIITTTSDKDAFKLTISQSSILHVDALPYSVGINDAGADLDIKITLLDANKQVIRVYDPVLVLNVVIDTILNTGTYYMMLDGTGNTNATEYASLGSYTINGTMSVARLLPVRSLSLSGKVDKNKHSLNWNIISDEPIKTLSLEKSTDAVIFSPLTDVAPNAKNFIYDPYSKADIFYRLKATPVFGQTIYSNAINLKSNENAEKLFTVSTIVHDEILVNAGESYQYLLADISGRILAKGSSSTGFNKINVNNSPNGIYIMQIISQNERITKRIIRQ
jgi:hypothetical protein